MSEGFLSSTPSNGQAGLDAWRAADRARSFTSFRMTAKELSGAAQAPFQISGEAIEFGLVGEIGQPQVRHAINRDNR